MSTATSVDLMLDWALYYAELGFPVLPLHVPTSFGPKKGEGRACCSCGKNSGEKPCESQGKHPRTANGLSEATTDLATIARWWKRWPHSNIGLVTGVAFDVLDLDGPKALEVLDTAMPADATSYAGPCVRTGRGLHRYYLPTQLGNRTNLVVKGSLIDWRGAGGYVVAPPSVHYEAGNLYEWLEGHEEDTPIGAAPAWLSYLVEYRRPAEGTLAALAIARNPSIVAKAEPLAVPHFGRTTHYGAKAVENIAGELADAQPGDRNDTLVACSFRLGMLVAGGEVDEGEALNLLLAGASIIGISCEGEKSEGVLTIRSGFEAGKMKPRRAPELPRKRGYEWKGVGR